MDRLSYRISAVALSTIACLLAGPGLALAGGGAAFPYQAGSEKIPDGHGKVVYPFMNVGLIGSTMTVTDANVSLRISHPRTHDLIVSLRSPSGQKVLLSRHDTKGTDLGTNPKCPASLPIVPPYPPMPVFTTFDDSGTQLSGAAAPYTGTYKPHSPLSALNGTQAN